MISQWKPICLFCSVCGLRRGHGNLPLVFGALSRQAGAKIVILIWWSRPQLLREIDIKPSGNEWSCMIIATRKLNFESSTMVGCSSESSWQRFCCSSVLSFRKSHSWHLGRERGRERESVGRWGSYPRYSGGPEHLWYLVVNAAARYTLFFLLCKQVLSHRVA